MSDCKFTQDDVCQKLNSNVEIKEEKGETLLTIKRYDSGAYDLLSRESTKDRYLTTEKTSYNFDTDEQIISALIKIFEDKNKSIVYIYDSYLDQNSAHMKTAFEQRSNDTTRFNTQRLNKDFFIKITDALKAYCKLPTDTQGPRFNMETFQKAIEAVDVLYPSIYLYSTVFPSTCGIMGGRKSRKTRKQRKARKTRKSRRTRRTKRRRTRK